MKISEIRKEDITKELVNRLVFTFPHDLNKLNGRAELAVVLGSKKVVATRVPTAIELYKQNRVKKLLFSGGVIHGSVQGEETEAQIMKKLAIRAGVNAKDILTETKSKNTLENFKFSQPILNQYKSLVVVTSEFHVKRAYLLCKAFYAGEIYTAKCYSSSANSQNWFKTQKGIDRAKGEVMAMANYAKNKIIADFEI